MARKLKAFQTSQGFFDLVIAAPSMKAALQAWGANSNLFHQGFAREVDDARVVAAAMAKPGVILKRPVGTDQPFREESDLPSIGSLRISQRKADPKPAKKSAKKTARQQKPPASQNDAKAARKAELAFQTAQRQRETQRRKDEAAAARAQQRRQKAMAAAEAELDQAKHKHAAIEREIETDRAAIEQRAEAEDARWKKDKERLDAALRRASR